MGNQPPRRLIVNADDFGKSAAINASVVECHREGILTTASLMVGEAACAEAVELARANPRLGVGLHLTLCCGRSVSPAREIPALVNPDGRFPDDPVRAGCRYFLDSTARRQLRLEIERQFERFAATGLAFDHVNGHLHFHLHPAVWPIVLDCCRRWQVQAVRLTREPWELDFLRESGRWAYRASHALVFGALAAAVRPGLAAGPFRHADQVFGLLQTGRVDEDYLMRLLPELPPGVSEIYSHPSMDEFIEEHRALRSGKVRRWIRDHDIALIRYQDL